MDSFDVTSEYDNSASAPRCGAISPPKSSESCCGNSARVAGVPGSAFAVLVAEMIAIVDKPGIEESATCGRLVLSVCSGTAGRCDSV